MLHNWLRKFFGSSKHLPPSSEMRAGLAHAGIAALGPERRSVTFKDMDVRSTQEGRATIFGYVHVYDTPGELRWFTETFKRGAFSDSVGKRPHYSFWNHNTSECLGNTENGTMMARSDDLGVYFEATPPDPAEAPYVQNALAQLRGKYVRGGSVGFDIEDPENDEVWEFREGVLHRDISRAVFIEASPAAVPVYSGTLIGARSWGKVEQLLGADIDRLVRADVDLMDMDIVLMEIGGRR